MSNYVENYAPADIHRDPHAVITIPLYELIDTGWVKWYTRTDSNGAISINSDWAWDYYDKDQYVRVCDKFNARFMWDEISILPPLRWKQQLIRRFNEIMPKYKKIYDAINNGVDPLQVSSQYGKSRNIFSEFPETILSGNSDYVSTGTDREHELINQGDVLDKFREIGTNFVAVDAMILDEMEVMFTSLYTANMNGW